ncbi:MAG: hypothetical protein AAFO69_10450 [Bacteroidota bacterium]
MKYTLYLLTLLFTLNCTSRESAQRDEPPKNGSLAQKSAKKLEYVTGLGDSVFSDPDQSGVMWKNYQKALADYQRDSTDVEHIIWLGRRVAYLGRYQEAIDIYTQGIILHPTDARLYRHRGHRYISSRAYDQAISDFEKATELIAGTEDQIEPDGIPNAQNTPVSTLHSNIWYHLGLAYYLKNDLDNAARCYMECAKISNNDDMIVSNAHWQYMTLRRQGKEAAAAEVLAPIKTTMSIIENSSYHRLALMYKGLLTIEDLQGTGGDPSNDAVMYGVGNYYLYNGDTLNAKNTYKTLLSTSTKASFGYIAAEADYLRVFGE